MAASHVNSFFSTQQLTPCIGLDVPIGPSQPAYTWRVLNKVFLGGCCYRRMVLVVLKCGNIEQLATLIVVEHVMCTSKKKVGCIIIGIRTGNSGLNRSFHLIIATCLSSSERSSIQLFYAVNCHSLMKPPVADGNLLF